MNPITDPSFIAMMTQSQPGLLQQLGWTGPDPVTTGWGGDPINGGVGTTYNASPDFEQFLKDRGIGITNQKSGPNSADYYVTSNGKPLTSFTQTGAGGGLLGGAAAAAPTGFMGAPLDAAGLGTLSGAGTLGTGSLGGTSFLAPDALSLAGGSSIASLLGPQGLDAINGMTPMYTSGSSLAD